MTAKRNTKKEKLEIPPNFWTIRQCVNILNADKFNISYDGLSYYRRLGIIPNPTRFKGYMDKFYFFPDLWAYITTAKLLTNLWGLRLEDLPFYMEKLSVEAYLDLPRILLKIHEKTFGLRPNVKGEARRLYSSLYDTLCLAMKKILNRTIKNLKTNISPEDLNDLLEKESQNYVETRGNVTILSDPY